MSGPTGEHDGVVMVVEEGEPQNADSRDARADHARCAAPAVGPILAAGYCAENVAIHD